MSDAKPIYTHEQWVTIESSVSTIMGENHQLKMQLREQRRTIAELRSTATAAYAEAAEAYRDLEQCEYALAAERAAHDATRALLGATLLAADTEET